jgi:hypothetical protein
MWSEFTLNQGAVQCVVPVLLSLWFGPLLFGGIVIGLWLLSGRRLNAATVVCLLWGAVYPIAQLLLWAVASLISPTETVLVGMLLGSLVTAALLWWMTGSLVPGSGCLIGSVLLVFSQSIAKVTGTSSVDDPYWIAGLTWNLPVAACSGVWLVRERLLRERRGGCAKCGYDLRGLPPGALCPECGTNRCAGCGYDLRGTPGRVCPECGNVAVVKQ